MVPRVLAVALLMLVVPAAAHAYSWPVKPFNRMHAVRGGFNDPRYHLGADQSLKASFHFGVDIAAPDGTAVYAVEPGKVVIGKDWVSVRRPNRRVFGYWHVRPVVKAGQHVHLHQLLGHTTRGWGHVHFAESVAGSYRNPLRRGALAPYRDTTTPVVQAIDVVQLDGHTLQTIGGTVSGTIGLTADAYDTPQVLPPSPWTTARLVPSIVKWQIIDPSGDPAPWRVAANLCCRLYPNRAFAWVFAPGTYQNKAFRPGDYRFWLSTSFDTTKLPNGTYWIVVEASDLHGNVGMNEMSLTIANALP